MLRTPGPETAEGTQGLQSMSSSAIAVSTRVSDSVWQELAKFCRSKARGLYDAP